MTALIENSAKRSTVPGPCSSICLEHTALSTSEQRSCCYCAALCTSDSARTLSSSRAALLSRSTASSNCKAVILVASDRELDVPGKGGEPAVSVGEGGEGWCRSSMLTRIDTFFFPTLFTLTFGKTSVTRRDVANVGARKPCRYHRVQCRQLHVYTYIHVH